MKSNHYWFHWHHCTSWRSFDGFGSECSRDFCGKNAQSGSKSSENFKSNTLPNTLECLSGRYHTTVFPSSSSDKALNFHIRQRVNAHLLKIIIQLLWQRMAASFVWRYQKSEIQVLFMVVMIQLKNVRPC